MIERIQPTLALLDQGLGLYRRHFFSFMLVSAAMFVPIAIVIGLGVAFASQFDNLFVILLFLLAALLLLLLSIYVVAVLSRAAAAALDGEPLRLLALMRVGPLRMIGMTVWTVVYLILAQVASTLVSFVLICPGYIGAAFVVGILTGVGGSVGSGAGVIGGLAIFGILYLLSIFVSGAVYGGMVYSLQPWAHDYTTFGGAIQRSIEMLFYRFWRNLGVWGLAAMLLVAAGTVAAVAVGVIVPLPLGMAFGFEAPAVQTATVVAWLTGLMLALPPLPIWMAMLYRRNRAAREGAELQSKIDIWQQLPQL